MKKDDDRNQMKPIEEILRQLKSNSTEEKTGKNNFSTVPDTENTTFPVAYSNNQGATDIMLTGDNYELDEPKNWTKGIDTIHQNIEQNQGDLRRVQLQILLNDQGLEKAKSDESFLDSAIQTAFREENERKMYRYLLEKRASQESVDELKKSNDALRRQYLELEDRNEYLTVLAKRTEQHMRAVQRSKDASKAILDIYGRDQELQKNFHGINLQDNEFLKTIAMGQATIIADQNSSFGQERQLQKDGLLGTLKGKLKQLMFSDDPDDEN